MTLWEFRCARAGYVEANRGEEQAPGMSEDRAKELGIEGF